MSGSIVRRSGPALAYPPKRVVAAGNAGVVVAAESQEVRQ